MIARLWLTISIAGDEFELLNLEHPEISVRIVSEIEAGSDVYYDNRWAATELFANYLSRRRDLFENKSVLILGAGIGLETLIVGRCCKKLYINDLSPVALELCQRQLERNRIFDVSALAGGYHEIELPTVDILIGSFLIYNKETLAAMLELLRDRSRNVLLMNEKMRHFKRLLDSSPRPLKIVAEQDQMVCVLFAAAGA